MTAAVPDPGSFRDPGGRIYHRDGRVFRAVMPAAAEHYRAARDSGLFEALTGRGLLIGGDEVDPIELAGAAAGAVHVVEHPRLPFVSYPYEWGFSLHRAAAVLHLDLHLAALERGFTLSDATAYNVQFIGTKPVFIDHLSLRPYREDEVWAAHRQFCMQFLAPLVLWSATGVAPNAWFRGNLDGLAPEDLSGLLPLRARCSWTVFIHVVAQSWLQRRALRAGAAKVSTKTARLPRQALVSMLRGLRKYIAGLKLKRVATAWSGYAADNSYSGDDAATKAAFVAAMIDAHRPRLVFDLGCNTGDYSEVALRAGAGYVVGFDTDAAALEQAVARFDATGEACLPLLVDLANPSPSQGWAGRERASLAGRGPADAVIALALIHHIVIGRNVPMANAIDWLTGLAPAGVIEFPQKTDPMVARLLAHRADVFPDYSEDAFLHALSARARIIRTERLAAGGRMLARFER